MLKKMMTLLLSAALLTGSLACLPVSANDGNLFKNGDFSKRLNSWQTWTNGDAKFEYQSSGGVDDGPCLLITNTSPVAASVFQFVNLEKGKSYLLSMDVKYEDISMEGPGVVLGSTMYDASNNNIGESISASRYGTSNGWTTMTMIVKIDNENCKTVNAGPRLWFSTGKVWVDNVSIRLMDMSHVTSGTYEMSLSDTPNKFTVDALGVEWDPKLLLPCNMEKGVTEDDLTFMKERLDTLGVQAVRMMMMPEWIEPKNDNDDPLVANADSFSFTCDDIKTALAYLRVCEELGIRVTLTWWGAATGDWLSYPDCGDWISAPNDLNEMAENIVYFLKYLRDSGINCVKQVILQNEPSYSFRVAGGALDFNYYVEYYKTVYNRLEAEGLGDIGLVAADDAQSSGWYMQAYDALKDYCVSFNSHSYQWAYDTPYLDTMVQEFVSTRTRYGQDKPFFIGEFGDGSTVGAYYAESVETYGRGLYLASTAVNAFKAGASGLSYWGLHDVYYYINTSGGDNGGLMETGLMGYKADGAWTYRPTYYAWGLLCSYIPYGSEIYDVMGDNGNVVDTVAVKTPEGKWSIIAVNRSGAEQTVKVSAAVGVPMNEYLFSEGTLPTDGSMIAASAVSTPVDGVYTVTLPAWSFKVLSDIDEVMTVDPETKAPTESDTLSEPAHTNEDEQVSDEATDPTVVTPSCVGDTSSAGCASTAGASAVAALLPATVAVAVRKKHKREIEA